MGGFGETAGQVVGVLAALESLRRPGGLSDYMGARFAAQDPDARSRFVDEPFLASYYGVPGERRPTAVDMPGMPGFASPSAPEQKNIFQPNMLPTSLKGKLSEVQYAQALAQLGLTSKKAENEEAIAGYLGGGGGAPKGMVPQSLRVGPMTFSVPPPLTLPRGSTIGGQPVGSRVGARDVIETPQTIQTFEADTTFQKGPSGQTIGVKTPKGPADSKSLLARAVTLEQELARALEPVQVVPGQNGKLRLFQRGVDKDADAQVIDGPKGRPLRPVDAPTSNAFFAQMGRVPGLEMLGSGGAFGLPGAPSLPYRTQTGDVVAQAYNAIGGQASAFVRLLGDVGALSDRDIERVNEKLLPNNNDTDVAAEGKAILALNLVRGLREALGQRPQVGQVRSMLSGTLGVAIEGDPAVKPDTVIGGSEPEAAAAGPLTEPQQVDSIDLGGGFSIKTSPRK